MSSTIAAPFLGGLGIGLLLAATFYLLYIRTLKRAAYVMRRAEATKEKFLSNVGHEVRTPLNGILGSSGLLIGSKLECDQRESVEIIKRSAEAILEVLEGVMDYLALHDGSLRFVREPLDLLQIVEEPLRSHVATLARRGIEVCNCFSSNVPRKVTGDPGRIRQVLSNLIGSAASIVESGQIVVRTRLVDRQPEGSLVQIEICCKAIGGPAAAESVDASLAITLSRSMAEAMGGYVETAFQPDGLVSFWLILQLPETMGLNDAPRQLSGGALISARRSCVSESLRSYCELAGVKTTAAPTGREMLNTLQERETAGDPFRFLLLDASDIDGATVELARRLGGPELCILGVTTAPEPARRELSKQLGLDALIDKPLDYPSFERALREADQSIARMESSS